ncbi:hypothetical protein NJ7G_0588 [Natrinema sp. J7-2]|nr:hypothetical protein NJ7G_0588 [Natrinema sp. J7-2]
MTTAFTTFPADGTADTALCRRRVSAAAVRDIESERRGAESAG